MKEKNYNTNVILQAPPNYYKLTPKQKKIICNGCGPKKIGGFVPDRLWGISIIEACNIHDYMYYMGENLRDKEKADRIFLKNMLKIIKSVNYPWWKMWLFHCRRKEAWIYYKSVRDFGYGPFFIQVLKRKIRKII